MDRNSLWAWTGGSNYEVALRKESVDRNPDWSGLIPLARESLSARRAWIEIFDVERLPEPSTVALRKESVDRNSIPIPRLQIGPVSLSARRAWIEILCC